MKFLPMRKLQAYSAHSFGLRITYPGNAKTAYMLHVKG